VETLRPRILILLRRCLYDNDDEVRDRATLYLNLLGDGQETVKEEAQGFIFGDLGVPLANLEASLQDYVSAHTLQPNLFLDKDCMSSASSSDSKKVCRKQVRGHLT
jgi:hypothetical protein